MVLAVARHRLDGLPHGGDRRLALARAHDQLRAVATLAAEQRRRPEHRDAGVRDQLADGRRRLVLGTRIGGRADHPDQVPVGRIARTPRAAAARPRGIRSASCAGGVAQRAGVRVERLDDHAPAALAAAAAPGQLGHERERALLGAEVGEAQRGVGVQHDAERHVREVVPLRHHLRADEHARGRRLEAPAARPRCPTCAAASESSRKTGSGSTRPRELALELLGPGAVARHRHRAAVRAQRRHGARGGRSGGRPARRAAWCSTSVTSQCGHSQTRPQQPAGEEVRPAAPVEQHDRLLAARAGPPRAPRACAGGAARRRRAIVDDLDRRQRAPVHALGQLEALVAQPGSRGAASRCRPAAPRPRPRRAARPPRARRSAGRPPACRRSRAPRRRRSGRGRRTARTPPSAGRRRRAPRRGAAATTRRSARRAESCECRIATRVAEALPRSAPAVCGVSAISGTSTIAERPRSSARGDRAQVDLGLAAAGHAVQQQRRARGAASIRRGDRLERGALRGGRLDAAGARAHALDPRPARRLGRLFAGRTRPRRSRLRSVACPRPATRATDAALAGPAASASSAARWRAPSAAAPLRPSAARPAVGELGAQRAPRAQRPRRAPVPVPGGSTSARPRAGVEQYSSATQRPSRTSSRRDVGLERRQRLDEPLRRAGRSARPRSTTTPSSRRRPNGTTSTLPDPHAREVLAGAGSRTARAARAQASAARPWRSPPRP